MTYVRSLEVVPELTDALLSLKKKSVSFWIVSVYVSSGSPILSSTKSNPLLIPSRVVFISRSLNWDFSVFFLSVLSMSGVSCTVLNV